MGDYNDDELFAPSWMDKLFFEEVLQKSEHDDSITISDMKITPATLKGDHFASIMFRVTIIYNAKNTKSHSISLIVKTMPEADGLKKETFENTRVFETEIGMYSKTIPIFEAELRKSGDETVLGARALYYSLKPRQVIIFEDIVQKGFVTIRHRMTKIEEIKAAFLKLAKWHAVSYKLAAEGNESVTGYREHFFNQTDIEYAPYMATGIENLIGKLETLEELKSYVPQLRLLQKKLFRKCIDYTNEYKQKTAEGVFVLCHGDFHSKNMMFKFSDKEELEDVMLLDFQVCFFGPAVMDLIYGLYVLVSPEIRKHHRNELIHYYCSNFIETLKRLNFEGKYPKIADFYIDIFRHRYLELFMVATFLPMWIAVSEKSADLEEFLTSNDARKKLYDNPSYVEELKRILPDMMHKGYLEEF